MTDYIYPTGVRLQGKVALVTGGARGIGAAITRAFVAQGAKVMIGDILEEPAKMLVGELGDDVGFIRLDVSDRGSWDAAVATTVSRFGSLSILVNNAGIGEFAPFAEIEKEVWDRHLAINLSGPFHGISAAASELKRAAPSSIVNISSAAGLRGYPTTAAYTASKFGVRGLTKVAAIDLAEDGIRANSIHPGTTNTEMSRKNGIISEERDFLPGVPIHRYGVPHEIALAAVYLASDESSYTTGAELSVDGGEIAGPGAVWE